MKKRRLSQQIAAAVFVVVSLAGFVFAEAAKPAVVQPAGPHKTNVAVINLKSSSGVTAGEAELISDRLRGELFNTGKVNVMERDQMTEILKEQGFQQSGACSNEACMVEIGQLLGVEQLVSGSLGKVGSMFLVNLRIIDVKTAKITKVVSKDIKGNIEDVVGELRPIAVELVGLTGTPQFVEKRSEEKPAETEQPKPESVSEPEKQEVAVAPTPDDRSEKNKNRAGVRLAANMYGNGLVAKRHSTFTDSYGLNSSTEVFTAADSLYNYSMFFNPQIKFFFKAGPVITIDIGPTYTYGSMESKDNSYGSYGNYLNVMGVAFGVNFVKRWYPVKMNLGLMVDFNYLLNMEEWKNTNMYSLTSSDSVAVHGGGNVSYGMRAGAEFMAGKHIGFNVDFLFMYSYFETFSETDHYSTGSTDEWYYSYLLPMLGIGCGVNFYY
jgi:TolB-like protein